MKFSRRSLRNLEGVHPDLCRVMHRAIAISDIDFTIIEGLRTKERQAELVRAGASKTMNSRHLTGHAVDVAPYVDGIRWDWPLFDKLAVFIKQAAKDCNVPIEWGGDWVSFRDGPHFQLPKEIYDGNEKTTAIKDRVGIDNRSDSHGSPSDTGGFWNRLADRIYTVLGRISIKSGY